MSLYTKYRPKNFDDLVEQDFIKNTLKTAVKENKTVGSYIFFGPRGTGKTSTARILAKAINCEKNIDGNPCLKCNICKSVEKQKLLDIIEIDAASNTGVDNIRDIIEKAQFSPNIAKYKVYIIDEVHMLSSGAFNALLKILEEPPKHLKFILATTEIHKVPETILSRCQRFDFKNISIFGIKKYLEYIAKNENIKTQENALEYIAKNSSGALRTAISLFEQLIVNNELKYENIIENLGIVGDEQLQNFLTKLEKKDYSIIKDFNQLIKDGKNIKLFFKDLIFFTKDKLEKSIFDGKINISLIEIIDNLEKYYLKTKNSIDENLVFFIGITKIISGYTEKKQEEKENKKNNFSKEKNKVDKKLDNVDKQVDIVENNDKIELNDAIDIFGNNDLIEKEDKKEILNTNDNSSFSIIELVNNIKKIPKKAFLAIGIKSSKYEIKENIFYIIAQNKFTKDKINIKENIFLIQEELKKMGFNYEVKVK